MPPAAHGFPAAQGFIAAHGFLALHGLLAAQGLHGFLFPARGAQGLHVGITHPTMVNDVPIAVPNNAAITAVLNGLVWVFIILIVI